MCKINDVTEEKHVVQIVTDLGYPMLLTDICKHTHPVILPNNLSPILRRLVSDGVLNKSRGVWGWMYGLV